MLRIPRSRPSLCPERPHSLTSELEKPQYSLCALIEAYPKKKKKRRIQGTLESQRHEGRFFSEGDNFNLALKEE